MKNKLRKAIALAAAGVMAAVHCSSTGLFSAIAAGEATAATAFPYTIEGEKMKGADLWTSIRQRYPDTQAKDSIISQLSLHHLR